jgi:hypothetical protein
LIRNAPVTEPLDDTEDRRLRNEIRASLVVRPRRSRTRD